MSDNEETVVETKEPLPPAVPITEVHIDGLAVLKIVKHCDTSAPNLVGGSLLGIDNDGVLEVTYSFPFPAQRGGDLGDKEEGEAEIDGVYYQTEMMTMLRDVNVDNNCVGWYQSMYLGTMFTSEMVDFQFKYQNTEDISDNSVVIMYDHSASQQGNLVLKAFRLTEAFVQQKKDKKNKFTKPSDMLEEIPVKIKNVGHAAAFARCLEDTSADEVNCSLEPLSMADSDVVTERHLRECQSWLEDLAHEQKDFHGYAKTISKPRMEQMKWLTARAKENEERRLEGDEPLPMSLADSGLKPLADAPPMTEPALMIGQLNAYAEQLNSHIATSFTKLYAAQQLNANGE